jgi:UPF0716 family protein affecting phage T7 exclusion
MHAKLIVAILLIIVKIILFLFPGFVPCQIAFFFVVPHLSSSLALFGCDFVVDEA